MKLWCSVARHTSNGPTLQLGVHQPLSWQIQQHQQMQTPSTVSAWRAGSTRLRFGRLVGLPLVQYLVPHPPVVTKTRTGTTFSMQIWRPSELPWTVSFKISYTGQTRLTKASKLARSVTLLHHIPFTLIQLYMLISGKRRQLYLSGIVQ